MFRQLFAVSLSELQEIRTLQSEEMNRYLFHAGIGGGSGIVQAERRLMQEMDKLYKPRGRVQESAKTIQTIDLLRGRLAESRSFLPRYNETVNGLIVIEQDLSELEARRARTAEELLLLRKALEIRPLWLSWREHLLELETLPESAAFPLNGLKRWEALQEAGRSLTQRSAKADMALEEIDAQLRSLRENPQLEESGPNIERIWTSYPLFEGRRQEKLELSAERKILEERLSRILQSIDSSWNADQLTTFKVSAAEKEDIRRMGASFAGYDRRMESLSLEHRSAQRALSVAESALREARRSLREESDKGESHFYMIRPSAPRETVALWGRLQLEADRWREARLARSQAETSPPRVERQSGLPAVYKKLLLGLSVLTLLLPSALLWTKAYEAAAATAVLLLGSDLYVWLSGRKERASGSVVDGFLEGKDESDQDLEGGEEVASLFAALIEDPYAAPAGESMPQRKLGPAGRMKQDPILLESRLRELRKLMEEWQGWQHRIQRLSAEAAAAEERVSQQETELSHIGRVLQQEERRFAELELEWEAWLAEKRLPDRLSPDGVMDIMAAAEQGNELIRQMRALSGKIDGLARDEADFEEKCFSLFRDMGIRDRGETSFLKDLYREWEVYRETMGERKHLLARRETLLREAAEIREELRRLREEEAALLQAGGAGDEEEFIRKGASVLRREELKRLIRHEEVAMYSGWDGDSRKRLEEVLNRLDASELEKACEAREADAANDDRERDELQERKGRLLQEKESLERKGSEEDSLQQLEEQQAALKDIVVQYAVRSIGAELIRRTRKMYEEEKQPHVLKLASRYFSRLTGGAYSRVLMRMEDQMLLAEQSAGALVESIRLSRGTAEQLYFAMRLALVDLMSGKGGIPLVLDDIFVNFDGDRLKHALELVRDVSTDRQVILMTCHAHVAGMIRDVHPGARFIHM
ncbi:hypothetical protein [Paenibacillus sp. DMB20]|uniref:hypothetical protein n=1 Tax=Paenibacillus sp. DMB20 TaxID=1642570 RepID=UPI0006282A26|nr:hypothetical protein [Paenibacillus sp. DMB20]KKO52775.1 hypothetical protein XI25_16000 [Paenibacillus sp. DMB20]